MKNKKFITLILLLSFLCCISSFQLFLSLLSYCEKRTQPEIQPTAIVLNYIDFSIRLEKQNMVLELGLEEYDFLGEADMNQYEYDFEHNMDYEDRYYHCKDVVLAFGNESKQLIAVGPFTDSENWSSYVGINSESTLDDVIKILGQPTTQETYELGGIIGGREGYSGIDSEFWFVQQRDGRYVKVSREDPSFTAQDTVLKGFIVHTDAEGIAPLTLSIQQL
jgi:hypothetical protein